MFRPIFLPMIFLVLSSLQAPAQTPPMSAMEAGDQRVLQEEKSVNLPTLITKTGNHPILTLVDVCSDAMKVDPTKQPHLFS
jgi:hypothetical protein